MAYPLAIDELIPDVGAIPAAADLLKPFLIFALVGMGVAIAIADLLTEGAWLTIQISVDVGTARARK